MSEILTQVTMAMASGVGSAFPELRFVPFGPALEQGMRLVWRTDRIQPEPTAAFLKELAV